MKTVGKIGIELGLSAAFLGVLTGCTTYVQDSRVRTVYVSPPPVYVEPPRIVVAQPVYVPPLVREVDSASFEIRSEPDFYEPLAPYGRWEVVAGYGRCWIPAHVSADWRPYTNGHWEQTERGWYWASDEPFAWATYHYGRWDHRPELGWYWVPQTQWAPAWVSWHHGGGYLGWAPLQPSVRVGSESPMRVDVRQIPSQAYVFVEEKHFLEPVRPASIVVNNTTVINQTVNITNVKIVNNTVINEGPRPQVIERASGRTVRAVPVGELRRQGEAQALSTQQRMPSPSPERIQVPGRSQSAVRPYEVQPLVDDRARELHQKAEIESQKNAKELERTAQRQSEQRAKELQKSAQEASQKAARELERKAQVEAQQHTRELQQKALEESQRHGRELQIKAQMAAQTQAKELEKKAQGESQKAARELEQKAQIRADQRNQELHRQAQDAAIKPAQGVTRPPGRLSPRPNQTAPATPPGRHPLIPGKAPQKKGDEPLRVPEKSPSPTEATH